MTGPPQTGVSQAEPRRSGALRILVADDVATNRQLFGGALRRAGHEVLFAEDGAAAVTLAASEHLDAILMDVQMEGVDGMEATRRIRRLPPPHDAVAIFALTADVSAAARARHLAAGMNFCLTKPVVWPDLFAALASVASGNATPAGVMPAAAAAEAAVAAPAFEPGPEDVPLLDLGLLQGLARNVPAPAFRGLLDRGLAGADESCLRLKAALGDPDRLAREAHRLRGTAGSFGLARVSALVGVLEERPGDAPDLAALVAEIETAVQATQRAVQELRLDPDST